ncbi:ABC transporter substrate-binding protein [Nitrobacter sp. 62-23]|uniref:ABC transporter substrate-binding protein n=1 Tax=Nitrobacter sp. 62-23 TaxID=1895798 RepID=UPI00092A26F3|nr:ABC transporter substrate-binding protein [Nitrobacter sp. 62-23]OJU99442.1 MAG: ABC transporter substrate-binding protein [Nitrobacter sp. 62-23]
MRIRTLLAALFGFCVVVAPATADQNAPRRDVVYYGDRHLSLPQTVTRVATTWEAQNAVIAMLGYGDRIVATTRIARSMPVFRKFVPSIVNASLARTGGSAGVNVEEMLALRPDVLFVTDMLPPAKREQLSQAGIAVAAFRANSIDAIIERTLITGEILGGKAPDIAKRYAAYFENNRRRVRERLEKIPQAARLKVYLASGAPLSTSGRPSLNQDWMDLGGAINVAENWFHDRPNASGTALLENVVASDPDVIITLRASDVEAIRNSAQWSMIKAVRNGRVYANPRGMFWWCRETSEEALQFLWVAKLLYPDVFADIDMVVETRAFYKDFYRIDLSDDEVKEFLSPSE